MNHSDFNEDFILKAIELAKYGSQNGHGGPFGAVVVKDGVVVGEGYNQVTSSNDPSAHAEIVAIRNACNNIGNFQLTGCTIYSSCEPCPMCLGAIYWSRPDKVYFASTKSDAANAGFDDAFIYDEIKLLPELRKIPMVYQPNSGSIKIFSDWKANPNKVVY